MSALDDVERAIRAVADRVGPAVVSLGRGWGSGSGVVIAQGQVLTNAHNLDDNAVRVRFADGETREGSVAAADPDGDLAVVAVDTGDTEPVEWADQGWDPQLGTIVVALARSGGSVLRVTFGAITATTRSFRGPRGRRITGAFEHSAPLARGSSGGPVVDRDGRLIGLNTNRMGEGFYLALPADHSLREQASRLATGTAPSRRQLGVAIAPGHVSRRLRAAVGLPERDGVLIQGVVEGSPADGTDLRRGDLIIAADGRSITSADDLFTAIEAAGPTLDLGIVRGTEDRTVAVRF